MNLKLKLKKLQPIKLRAFNLLDSYPKKVRSYFVKNSKKYFRILDFIVLIFVLYLLNLRQQSLSFIYKSNRTALSLITPLIILFLWLGLRKIFDKNILLQTAGIILAVFVFLISVAQQDDSKIQEIFNANYHNCSIASYFNQHFKASTTLSQNFLLNYFAPQPYLNNVNFIFQYYGTTSGAMIFSTASSMEAANSLIRTIHDLNVQGSTATYSPRITESIHGYNEQLRGITQKILENICTGQLEALN